MSSLNPIRILMVDDHKVTRKGLSVFISAYPDLKLVGEAASGKEAIQLYTKINPDVVIMDLQMPQMNGIETILKIREQDPRARILVFTSFTDDDLIQNSIGAGAIGYLLKDVDADVLANAIRSAHVGRATLGPEAIQALTTAPDTLGHDLTNRERQVLQLLVDGLTNAEIAYQFGIRVSTIKFHVGNIMSKLGVSTRTEVTALALRHKILERYTF